MKKFLLLLWIFLVPVFCMTRVYADILPESELLPESEDSWEEDYWEEDAWSENGITIEDPWEEDAWSENGIIVETPPKEETTSSNNAESEPSTSEDTQTEPLPTTSDSNSDSSNTTGDNNNTSAENTETEPFPTTSESNLDSSDTTGNNNTSSENAEAEPFPATSEINLDSSNTNDNNNTSSENTETEPSLTRSNLIGNNNTSSESTETKSSPTTSENASDSFPRKKPNPQPKSINTSSSDNNTKDDSDQNNGIITESTNNSTKQNTSNDPLLPKTASQDKSKFEDKEDVSKSKDETKQEDKVPETTLSKNKSSSNNDNAQNSPSNDNDNTSNSNAEQGNLTPTNNDELSNPTATPEQPPSTDNPDASTIQEEETKEETTATPQEENSEPEVQPLEPVQDIQNTVEETVEEPNISQILANNVVVVADNLNSSFSVDAQIGPQQIFLIDIGEGYSKPEIVDHLNNSQIFIKDNLLTYIPNLGFVGVDTFSYTVIDSEGNAVNKQIRVKVAGKDEIIPVENCQLYFVHDGESSDSQFVTVDPSANTVIKLGPQYDTFDIEGMAINPVNGLLYAISGKGKRNQFDGYLYRVNPDTGGLTVVGDTGFSEPSSLAFRPDGTLWSWSKQGRKGSSRKNRLKSAGIIQIDPNTAESKLLLPSEVQVEGLAWDESGRVLYATEETSLWAFDNNQLRKRCSNLSAEVEALETLANGMLLLGFNEYDGNSVYLYDPESCEEIVGRSFPIPSIKGDFDVESIAWSFDCQPTVEEETCLDEEGKPIAECPLEETCLDEEGKPITDNTECPLKEAVESTDCTDEEGNPVQNENCPAEPMNSVENPEEAKSETCVDKEGNPVTDKDCPMTEATPKIDCEKGQSDCIKQESEPVNQTQETRQAQKEEANQQATHCPFDEMVPCPALDKEAVEQFFAHNPVAELVQLEEDGLLFVLLDEQLHYGFFSYSLPPKRVKKLTANPILEVACEQNDKTAAQLKLAAIEDVNGDSHDDFIMTYCDGQTQMLFYLGRADQAQEESIGENQEQQTDGDTTTEEGEGIGENQEQQTDSETTTNAPETTDSEPKEESTSQPESTSFADNELFNNAEDRASALELEPSNSDENQQELTNNLEQEENTSSTTEEQPEDSEEEITSIAPDKQEERTYSKEPEPAASEPKEESNSVEKTELNLSEPAQLSSSPPEQDNSTDAVEHKQTSSKKSSDKEKSAKQSKSSSQSSNEESTQQKESNGTAKQKESNGIATPSSEPQPKESVEKQSGSSDNKSANSAEQKKPTGSDPNPQNNSNDQDQSEEVNNQENHTENPSN